MLWSLKLPLLVALLTLLIYILRLPRRWRGQGIVSTDQNGYQMKINKGRHGHIRMRIGIDVSADFDFEIRPINWLNRWMWALGFARSQRFHHSALHDQIYLASDDFRLYSALSNDQALIAEVCTIFVSAEFYAARVKRIIAKSGLLWVDYHGELTSDQARELSYRILAALTAINQTLTRLHLVSPRQWRKIPAQLLWALFLSTTAGYYLLDRLWLDDRPAWLLDPLHLIRTASGYGVALAAGIAILCLLGMRRSAHSHDLLLPLLLCGSIGFPLLGYAEMNLLNQELDHSHGQSYRSAVSGKSCPNPDQPRDCILYLRNWNTPADQPPIRHPTSGSTSAQIPVGARITLRQHPGYLGYPWYEQVRLAPDSPDRS